jgi:GT2 family glycosyltransferase
MFEAVKVTKIFPLNTVTVVCTSFNRPDLLERTLRSFYAFNTHQISRFIVQDDSCHIGCNDHLCDKFPNVEFRYNPQRLGQIRSADVAYEDADTPYIFHMEEDWEFYRHGFIEDSMKVLVDRPNVVCVWIRSATDTNGHGTETPTMDASGVKYRFLKHRHSKIWHGFTFNPSLRRKSDWEKHGGYSLLATFIPTRPWEAESAIGNYYMRKGYSAALIVGNGYTKHIGENRGIRK